MADTKRRALPALCEITGAGLAAFALLLSLVHFSPAYAEIKTVVAQGKTDVCFARETALDLARTGASNEAHGECWALGKGWSFSGVQFPGYSQCFRCGKSEEFRCAVTQAVYNCVNMDKENAEKAAKKREEEEKLRAEKELETKLAKEKRDRERAELLQKKKDDADRDAKVRAQKALEAKQLKEKAEAARIEQLRKQKETEDIAAKANAEKLLAAKQAGREAEVERAKLVAKKKEADDKLAKAPPVKNSPPIKAAAGSTTEKTATTSGLGASVLDAGASEQQSNIHSLLDASAERPAIQKRLAQETANFRSAAEPACKNTLGQIDACYEKTGCAKPADRPSVEACKRVPIYPGSGYGGMRLTLTRQPSPGEVCYREDAECLSARAQWAAEKRDKDRQESEELARQQSAWNSNYASLSSECQQRGKERAAYAVCQKQYDAACNPGKFNSVNECVNQQVKAKGPSEQDARKLMQKDWDQRAKTGSSITNSILD